MINTELQQFYNATVEKIMQTLPTHRLNVEEHLFKFSIDYNHLSELLWSKYSGKKTDSYVLYLFETMLEHFFAATVGAEIPEQDCYEDVITYYNQIQTMNEKTIDDMLVATLTLNNNEVLGEPGFRVALAVRALEIRYNVTLNLIFDHYNS